MAKADGTGRECAVLVMDAVRSKVSAATGGVGSMSVATIVDQMARRIALSADDLGAIALRGLRALHPLANPGEEMDDADGFAEDLKRMVVRGDGLPAEVRSIMRERTSVATLEDARDLAKAARSGHEDPDLARMRAASAGTLPAGSVSHRPINMSGIDVPVLRGVDAVLKRATGGQVASAMDLLTRLVDAERAVAEAEANVVAPRGDAEGGDAAPVAGAPAGYRWTAERVPLSQVVAPGKVREGADDGVDKAALMKTMVQVWTSVPPHPRVPGLNPGRVFEAEALATCLYAIDGRKTVALVGPTGCGKTSLFQELAARLGRPFYKTPIDGEIRRQELIGGFKQFSTPTGSETRWVDGLVLEGIRHPAVVVLDEFDRADPNLLYAAHQVLEHDDVVILEDGGRTVHMHPQCAVVATANTKGRSDATGLYAASSELSEASRDRITFWVDCDYLSANDEVDVLTGAFPSLDAEGARRLVTFANGVRQELAQGHIRTACSTRNLLEAVEWYVGRKAFAKGGGQLKRAARNVIVARASDEMDRAAMQSTLDTVFG